MKIGIIVYSYSGNTLLVAQKLLEKLLKAGHEAIIERVLHFDEQQMDPGKVQFKMMPDLSKYEALIVGGPVRGFAASPIVKAYLKNIEPLTNRKVALMVTQFFPFTKMGGEQAIKYMKNECVSKGAQVCGTGIVNWSSRLREKKIGELVEQFAGLF